MFFKCVELSWWTWEQQNWESIGILLLKETKRASSYVANNVSSPFFWEWSKQENHQGSSLREKETPKQKPKAQQAGTTWGYSVALSLPCPESMGTEEKI